MVALPRTRRCSERRLVSMRRSRDIAPSSQCRSRVSVTDRYRMRPLAAVAALCNATGISWRRMAEELWVWSPVAAALRPYLHVVVQRERKRFDALSPGPPTRPLLSSRVQGRSRFRRNSRHKTGRCTIFRTPRTPRFPALTEPLYCSISSTSGVTSIWGRARHARASGVTPRPWTQRARGRTPCTLGRLPPFLGRRGL